MNYPVDSIPFSAHIRKRNAMANPQLGIEGLPYQFSSTRQPANAGRKPSKLKKYLKDNNLSSLDARLIAKNMLNLSREELKVLAADETKPILITGAAKALLADVLRGKADIIAWLQDRAWGKAEQRIEHAGAVGVVAFTPAERKAALDEYIKNNPDILRGGGDAAAGEAEGPPRRVEEADEKKPGTPESADHQ
jgi:hypothetical protein